MSTTQTGFIIDRDYINKGEDDVPSRVGVKGIACEDGFTFEITRDDVPEIVNPVRFRVLDDDGEVYYGGVIARDWLDGDENYAFAPLDWARHDAGATELQYRHFNSGEWRTL